MQSTDQILCHLLRDSAVRSVLVLGERANELRDLKDLQVATEEWHGQGLRPGFPPRNLASFDLIYLANLPTTAAIPPISPELAHCLSFLQSFCRGELLVEFATRCGLATDNAFLSLGFSRALLDAQSKGRFAVYRYSLHSYKSPPDWLNSKHWANPERWNQE